MIAFGIGIASCMVVLWPPKDDAWTFVTGPKQLIEDWVKTERPDLSHADISEGRLTLPEALKFKRRRAAHEGILFSSLAEAHLV